MNYIYQKNDSFYNTVSYRAANSKPNQFGGEYTWNVLCKNDSIDLIKNCPFPIYSSENLDSVFIINENTWHEVQDLRENV